MHLKVDMTNLIDKIKDICLFTAKVIMYLGLPAGTGTDGRHCGRNVKTQFIGAGGLVLRYGLG